MKQQPLFHFSPQQLAEMRAALSTYCAEELDLEIGDLQADLFISFLSEQLGKEFYNLGVADAIKAIKEKSDDLVLLIKD